MMVHDVLREMSQAAVQALTPVQRWSAARRMGDGSSPYASQYGFILLATVTLVVLICLLWWISHRRGTKTQTSAREWFAENALRRGLSGRERQILLAIAMRSGLGQSHEIFTTAAAFDRGAAKLLAECVRTRTAEENDRLKTEVAYLREKLGFRASRVSVGDGSRRPSSRDIPVGKLVEVTRRRRHPGVPIRAEVVRNDDLELAVELDEPVAARAGDLWCARYAFGVYVWEFDATAVTCTGTRLVLNHTDVVRFVNRRRFPRVAVTMPALVARFPFARRAGSVGGTFAGTEGGGVPMGMAGDAPLFVEGTIRELAGPGLRIDLPGQMPPGERVLVVFRPTEGVPQSEPEAHQEQHIIEDIGQVRHSRVTSTGVSIAVELVGLNEAEVDELVRITNTISSRLSAQADEQGAGESDAVAAESPVVQEV